VASRTAALADTTAGAMAVPPQSRMVHDIKLLAMPQQTASRPRQTAKARLSLRSTRDGTEMQQQRHQWQITLQHRWQELMFKNRMLATTVATRRRRRSCSLLPAGGSCSAAGRRSGGNNRTDMAGQMAAAEGLSAAAAAAAAAVVMTMQGAAAAAVRLMTVKVVTAVVKHELLDSSDHCQCQAALLLRLPLSPATAAAAMARLAADAAVPALLATAAVVARSPLAAAAAWWHAGRSGWEQTPRPATKTGRHQQQQQGMYGDESDIDTLLTVARTGKTIIGGCPALKKPASRRPALGRRCLSRQQQRRPQQNAQPSGSSRNRSGCRRC